MMEQSQSHTKKSLIILIGVVSLIAFFFIIFLKTNKEEIVLENNEKKCISDGLEVSYPRDQEKAKYGMDRPLIPIEVTVSINGSIKNFFRIENVPPNQDAFDFRDCNLYISRYWDFDYKKFKSGLNARFEIWKYPYDGESPEILVVTSKKINGESGFIYQSQFSVSNSEKYISLVKGYVGSEDYALHIKDIETKENVVEVNLTTDLFKKYPNIVGDVEFRGWSEDEKYFWFSLFDQANVLAFVKVDMSDSGYEVFDAPVGMMNQDAFNLETGWVTYDDGPPWTGIKEFEEEYQKEWDEAGDFVTFYLYNLFSKEKIDLEKTTDTTWWHYPKWLDNETLEYKIPSGEWKTYKIKL